MRIHRLRITNYRGIEALDQELPPAGVVARGGNGKGKTTVLRAIRAALAGRDVGPDAIRAGADRAEILVDLDDHTVRRLITESGSTLTVETAARDRKRAPQAWLTELLGSAPLDPLDLFLADPKKRRELVLNALPVKATEEHVRAWLPEQLEPPPGFLERLPDLHGLEAAAILHRTFYERRAALNAEVKNAKGALDHREGEARKLATGIAVPPSVQEAEEHARAAAEQLEAARRASTSLNARQREAHAFAERTSTTREAIALKRTAVERAVAEVAAFVVPDLASLRRDSDAAERALEGARQAYEAAKRSVEVAHAALVAGLDQETRAAASRKRGEELAASADELEATLASTAVHAPAQEELDAAAQAIVDAEAGVERTNRAGRAAHAFEDVADKRAELEALTSEAAALTAIVTKLANDAPAQLLAESKGIPGLGVAGDELTLDGVRIDALCGAEAMKFAVEVAKRANARSKILVCDGLERLDPEQLEAFVAHATAGGWQLIASRVDRGDMVLEAIAIDEGGKQAAE